MQRATHSIGSDVSAVDAAREILHSRISRTRRFLKRVSKDAGKRSEDVHQLRVATRRLGTALTVFESCLPDQRRKALKKAARKVRRVCSAARDADVLHNFLKARLERGDVNEDAVKPLTKTLRRRQQDAYQELESTLGKRAADFEAAANKLTKAIGKKPKDPATPSSNNSRSSLVVIDDTRFVHLANDAVENHLNDFMLAASVNLDDLNRLHTLRIAAKHLRYAMEVTESCYPADFGGRLYKAVESVQSRLGEINDLRNLVAAGEEALAGTAYKEGKKQSGGLREVLDRWKLELEASRVKFVQVFCDEEIDILHLDLRRIIGGQSGKGDIVLNATKDNAKSIDRKGQLQS